MAVERPFDGGAADRNSGAMSVEAIRASAAESSPSRCSRTRNPGIDPENAYNLLLRLQDLPCV